MEQLVKVKIIENKVEVEPPSLESTTLYVLFTLVYCRVLWLLDEQFAINLRDFCLRHLDNKNENRNIISKRHSLNSKVKFTLYLDENGDYILENNNFFKPDSENLRNFVKQLLQYILMREKSSSLFSYRQIIENIYFGYLTMLGTPVNKSVFLLHNQNQKIVFNNLKKYIKVRSLDLKGILEEANLDNSS